jgi:Flp pilus assembly protein CpaB
MLTIYQAPIGWSQPRWKGEMNILQGSTGALMTNRTYTVAACFVVALLLTLILASLSNQVDETPFPPYNDQNDLMDMVVAVRPLRVGSTVGEEDVKLVRTSPELFPKGAFSRTEEVTGRKVIIHVLADEPVVQKNIGP